MKLPLLIAFVLAMGAPALAQERPREVDDIFDWVTPATPGCSVAASMHGTLVLDRAYGVADIERQVPLTSASIFDAGSVVKQFVAAATLVLVEEGRLSLTADVRTYIPELPDYGHRITLDHLLTHTSGIRDWTGLGPLTGRNIDALTLTLRQRALDFVPGEEWAYSNSGYVLLKDIVARTSGMSFAEFTRGRFFEPLGMTSTAYIADPRVVIENRALAYEQVLKIWLLDTPVGNERGGGGALFSTPKDLLLWNTALADGTLGAFVTEKLQEPARLNNGRTLGYGRGLFLDTNRAGRVIWHSGGAGGYSTSLVRFPEQGFSVAVMCNAGERATSTAYARRIFELFVPTPPGSEAIAAPPRTPGGEPALPVGPDRAGLFFSEITGQPLRLVADSGRLRIANGPVLETLSSDRFRNPRGVLSFMSQDAFELHFVSADRLDVTSMEGVTTSYRRAERVALTADDLQAYTGRYGNDETSAVLDVAPGGSGLTVRIGWNEARPLTFAPVDRDTFQMGGMLLRFRRDSAGRIMALDYSNPVVRNVAFTRLPGQSERR